MQVLVSEPVSIESYNVTLNTMCIIMLRPGFPGYFPVVFMGERSNSVAPVSWQTACTNIFFPTPGGPASSMDFIRGLFSWSTCAPAGSKPHELSPINETHCSSSPCLSHVASIPSGKIAYKDMTCRTSVRDGIGSISFCLSVVPR